MPTFNDLISIIELEVIEPTGFEFQKKISPETLTTLALLIAESDPKEKEKIVGLVLLILR